MKTATTAETVMDFKVYYADTDAYGVVWHGTYLRWFEAARTEFLCQYGISIEDIQSKDKVVMPVIEINVQYKASVKTGEKVKVFTSIEELKQHYVVFRQIVKGGDKIYTTATVKCVGVDENGRLIRNMDVFLRDCSV